MNNKVLLCSTGNYIQYSIINHNEKNLKNNIYIYIYSSGYLYININESPCCMLETNTTL